MTPNKLTHFLPVLCARTGLSESVLKQLAREYFRLLQQDMGSLKHVNIDVPGLGTFSLKTRALSRKILKTKQMLEKMSEKTSFRAQKISEELRTDLAKLENLQQLYSNEVERKAQIQSSRHESSETTV